MFVEEFLGHEERQASLAAANVGVHDSAIKRTHNNVHVDELQAGSHHH